MKGLRHSRTMQPSHHLLLHQMLLGLKKEPRPSHTTPLSHHSTCTDVTLETKMPRNSRTARSLHLSTWVQMLLKMKGLWHCHTTPSHHSTWLIMRLEVKG